MEVFLTDEDEVDFIEKVGTRKEIDKLLSMCHLILELENVSDEAQKVLAEIIGSISTIYFHTGKTYAAELALEILSDVDDSQNHSPDIVI